MYDRENEDTMIDAQSFLAWLQSRLDGLGRYNTGNYNMYLAGAAKSYEVMIKLVQSGAITKKGTCP
ncbi:Hypothetical protein LUCI_2818 [Lucifera butyrica]|uniref:Uncharacterized protein n=1 Tax=Lucifera butyrica TaxID=1351585 RepID=A0A498RBP3_9FIRM|nr:Hypothetical protein LUCI_2818 [Lucifera butyrica]